MVVKIPPCKRATPWSTLVGFPPASFAVENFPALSDGDLLHFQLTLALSQPEAAWRMTGRSRRRLLMGLRTKKTHHLVGLAEVLPLHGMKTRQKTVYSVG